jgi:hypothetical protein
MGHASWWLSTGELQLRSEFISVQNMWRLDHLLANVPVALESLG